MQETDRGNLMGAKAWILSFQVNDQLAHRFRETTLRRRCRSTLAGHEAGHPLLLKEPRLTVERALTCSSFFRPLSRSLSEQYDRAQPLILLLFWPERLLLDLLPIMSRFAALSLARWHD